MKKLIFFSLLLFTLFFFSCKKTDTAASLVPDNYQGWTVIADNLNYPIPGHENHSRKILINPIGEGVSTEKKNGRVFYDYPRGTIILKEIYPSLKPEKGAKPVSLTVMLKDPDNPKNREGWVWIVKDLKKNSEKIIDYEFCFDCHNNANEQHPYGDGNPEGDFRDYVYFPYRK